MQVERTVTWANNAPGTEKNFIATVHGTLRGEKTFTLVTDNHVIRLDDGRIIGPFEATDDQMVRAFETGNILRTDAAGSDRNKAMLTDVEPTPWPAMPSDAEWTQQLMASTADLRKKLGKKS